MTTEILMTVYGDGDEEGDVPTLVVRFHQREGVCTLTLAGDLVTGTIAELEEQIDQLGCTTSLQRLIVDARELGSMDGVGRKVLVGLHHYVRGREAELVVLGATREVAEQLSDTELEVRGQ